MHLPKWQFLPFIGASAKKQDHTDEAKKRHDSDDANGSALSHHGSAAAFAQMTEEDIVRDYNAPITWWVLSTLFPLMAGTFGPMASTFNIMAVAIDWRVIILPGNQEAEGQKITDPRWLVGVNAVSLVVGISANLVLLAQMGGRLRFNIASPITIVGWFISGFIDVGLVAAAPSVLPLPDNALATFSQAYYYAIFAGALYIILSLMLMMTAWGVWIGHFSSEFKLTISQRSLMLQTMLFLGYVLAAGAVYSRIEDWDYLDACYYIVVTLFTIGLGDFSPATHLGRSLFFPMSVGGIIFVGLIIANIRSLVIESASVKVSTRLVEIARNNAIRSGNIHRGIIKIRGVFERDLNATTELERRENEFNSMREIQSVAAHNNRLLALLFSLLAFCILWFIGAVIFWQAEMAPGGQNWSYFEALYFTYTAQLTIGYGDYAPQTNSAKPAFVFWALIALPTLTVLIGAIGDAASDAVNWFFNWMGRHSEDLLRLIQTLKAKPDRTKDIIELAQKETRDEEDGHAFQDIALADGHRLIPTELQTKQSQASFDADAANNAYRPFVVLQAAQRVLSHLEEDKSRKYSFEEWTWLLRLLGEDESHSKSHRRPNAASQEPEDVGPPGHCHRRTTWSWIGQESPLMDLQDDSEPKWALKRLLRMLEEDVRRRAVEHLASRSADAVIDKK